MVPVAIDLQIGCRLPGKRCFFTHIKPESEKSGEAKNGERLLVLAFPAAAAAAVSGCADKERAERGRECGEGPLGPGLVRSQALLPDGGQARPGL